MKKIIHILCLPIILLLSSVLVACAPKDPGNINISFDSLKSIVNSEDMNAWQGVDVKKSSISETHNCSDESVYRCGDKRYSAVGHGNNQDNAIESSFKSKKNESGNVSFEHIKNQDNKVYCDNGIRYHKSPNRNYIDESQFNYDDYLEYEVLEGCLSNIKDFFDNNENATKLLTSKKEVIDTNTIYTFEIKISDNTMVLCQYTFNNINVLININITIFDGFGDSIQTDISENTEVITTPDWFDSDEYKTEMTYTEMRDVVMDVDQYSDWSAVQISYPSNMTWGELAQNIMVDKDSGYYVVETNEYKEFCDGSIVYRYDADGNAISVNDVNNATIINEKSYTYTDNLQTFMNSYQMFFAEDADFFYQFYVTSKKYEKDVTIKSFKLLAEAEGYRNDAIVSFYYDLEDNIQKVYIYTSSYSEGNPDMNYEKQAEMKLTDNIDIPEWFNINDFEAI